MHVEDLEDFGQVFKLALYLKLLHLFVFLGVTLIGHVARFELVELDLVVHQESEENRVFSLLLLLFWQRKDSLVIPNEESLF